MSRLYDQLPGKAKDAFLKEWSTIETLNLKADEIDQRIKAALAKATMDSKKFQQRLKEFALKKDKLGVDQAKIPNLVRDLMYTDPESATVALTKARFTPSEIEQVFAKVFTKASGTSGPATPLKQVVTQAGATITPSGFTKNQLQSVIKAIQP